MPVSLPFCSRIALLMLCELDCSSALIDVSSLANSRFTLCSVSCATENDDIMIITNEGTIIRTPVADIPVYSRTASGVIVMRLAPGASIVNTTIAAAEAEDEAAESEAEE